MRKPNTDGPPHAGEDRAPRGVLVIDDEPGVRDVSVEVLRAAQYDVDEATTGDALDCLGRQLLTALGDQ